jgi:hypothetical protein
VTSGSMQNGCNSEFISECIKKIKSTHGLYTLASQVNLYKKAELKFFLCICTLKLITYIQKDFGFDFYQIRILSAEKLFVITNLSLAQAFSQHQRNKSERTHNHRIFEN